jgi:hypothetical protein
LKVTSPDASLASGELGETEPASVQQQAGLGTGIRRRRSRRTRSHWGQSRASGDRLGVAVEKRQHLLQLLHAMPKSHHVSARTSLVEASHIPIQSVFLLIWFIWGSSITPCLSLCMHACMHARTYVSGRAISAWILTWQTSSSACRSSSTSSPLKFSPPAPAPPEAAVPPRSVPPPPPALAAVVAAGSIPASRMHSAVSSIAERHAAKASSKAGGGTVDAGASLPSVPPAAGAGEDPWEFRRRRMALLAVEETLCSMTAK